MYAFATHHLRAPAKRALRTCRGFLGGPDLSTGMCREAGGRALVRQPLPLQSMTSYLATWTTAEDAYADDGADEDAAEEDAADAAEADAASGREPPRGRRGRRRPQRTRRGGADTVVTGGSESGHDAKRSSGRNGQGWTA